MVIDVKQADFPDQRQIEIYRKMTPQDKLRAFNRLYWQAWEVKKAGVRMRHPEWDEVAVEDEVRRVFVRTVT